MAIFTLTEIEAQIASWKQALLACSTGQSYTIGTRTLSRADLPEIRATLTWLDTERDKLTAGIGPAMLVSGRPSRG